jgi:hypothetical protein
MTKQHNNTRLISGTFIGLDHFHDAEGARFNDSLRSLSEDHWRQMLHDMVAIGIDTLIMQQAIDCRHGVPHPQCGAKARTTTGWDNPKTYYNSKKWQKLEWIYGDPFGAIVDEADELGMTIIYGIGTMFTKDPYLYTDDVIEQARVPALELLELYGDRPSFGGWYWSYEYPPSSISGRDSLRKIVPAIRKLADCPFMISPNADRLMSATLLQDIDVDIIAYQDTVGVGFEPDPHGRSGLASRHQVLDRLPYFYQALQFAHDGWKDSNGDLANISYWNTYFRERGRTALWNDVEIWELDHNLTLVPTEIARIASQLDLTAPYVDKQIIFQYPGLMQHPDHPVKVGGERAVTLYEQYALYRDAVLAGRK